MHITIWEKIVDNFKIEMSLFKSDGTRIQPPLEPLMKFYRWQFFSVIVCPPWWHHQMGEGGHVMGTGTTV